MLWRWDLIVSASVAWDATGNPMRIRALVRQGSTASVIFPLFDSIIGRNDRVKSARSNEGLLID